MRAFYKTPWPAAALFLVLASCTRLENVAAGFIPTGHQDFDAAELKSGTYRLDPRHASLQFSFDHMGFSTAVVRFDAFDATLVFDNESPHMSALEVTVDLASVNTNDAEFDELLKSRDFFDVGQFPAATFTASEVYFIDQTTGEVPGILNLHGVEQPVVLNVTFRGGAKNWISGDYTLGFEATASVQRSAFGLNRLLPLTGDDVTITIHAEFNLEDE